MKFDFDMPRVHRKTFWRAFRATLIDVKHSMMINGSVLKRIPLRLTNYFVVHHNSTHLKQCWSTKYQQQK